ncbi:MAG TPA: hypothetical protein VFS68_11530, partial [Candidatus Udaeobacter sp.]|nr:hypothetical protein [Candidatus Udaeobacter sp.]
TLTRSRERGFGAGSTTVVLAAGVSFSGGEKICWKLRRDGANSATTVKSLAQDVAQIEVRASVFLRRFSILYLS